MTVLYLYPYDRYECVSQTKSHVLGFDVANFKRANFYAHCIIYIPSYILFRKRRAWKTTFKGLTLTLLNDTRAFDRYRCANTRTPVWLTLTNLYIYLYIYIVWDVYTSKMYVFNFCRSSLSSSSCFQKNVIVR